MIINNFHAEHSFLSNFHPCEVQLDGLTAPTVEHAFQAAKTHNIDERLNVINQSTPGRAKRAGRKVTLRNDWEQVKLAIMKDLLEQKFSFANLGHELVDTAPHFLVEGNNWGDTFWGVCNGEGENHLGKLLMEIRSDLISF